MRISFPTFTKGRICHWDSVQVFQKQRPLQDFGKIHSRRVPSDSQGCSRPGNRCPVLGEELHCGQSGVLFRQFCHVILLALLLIIGFAAPAFFSAEQTGQPKDREATEIEWQHVLTEWEKEITYIFKLIEF